ncbi:MAG: FtsX-like permease family protein [Patescibacteria group bacterium]
MKRIHTFRSVIRVAFFLGIRQIRRANPWTTVLIIFIMALTFLNLVVVSGILVGLIEGSESAYKEKYSGEIFITKPQTKDFIENSPALLSVLENLPEVKAYSPRILSGGNIEANYHNRLINVAPNSVSAGLSGIDPILEDKTTGLSEGIVRGIYLDPLDNDGVLVGSNLLEQYSVVPGDIISLLKNTDIGSKILITIGGSSKEYTVRGILNLKVDDITLRVFMNKSELRLLSGGQNANVSQIAVRLKNPTETSALFVKNVLLGNGFGDTANIKTWIEAQPKFLKDIKVTFAILGNAISSIGLVVAAITLFIVIFINAITRRRYIGILKGIGIDEFAIELSYVIQSFFYAVIGTTIGLIAVYGFLVPSFLAHPIDFPFSDGILVAPI